MSDSLLSFFNSHPFWAVFIIVFMVLPIIGAVAHIVLKAMGRRGIDNTTPQSESFDSIKDNDLSDYTDNHPPDSKK
jgi:hypothetical protein